MSCENEDFGGQFEDGSAVPRRAVSLAWPIVLVAAVAIHQVTGSAIAAAALFAIHAGWRSFRCALWLKRVDPVAARGRACFWFYLATAFWKAAAWAFAVVLIFGAIEAFAGQPPPDEELIIEGCIMAGGVCLSTAVGIVAVGSALRGRVRVWVHANIRDNCNGDFNRVGDAGGYFIGNARAFYHGFNHAIFIVGTSVAVPIVVCATALLAWSTARGQPPDAGTWLELLGLFASFPVAVVVYAVVADRIIARTPAECWPPGTLTHEQLIATARKHLFGNSTAASNAKRNASRDRLPTCPTHDRTRSVPAAWTTSPAGSG